MRHQDCFFFSKESRRESKSSRVRQWEDAPVPLVAGEPGRKTKTSKYCKQFFNSEALGFLSNKKLLGAPTWRPSLLRAFGHSEDLGADRSGSRSKFRRFLSRFRGGRVRSPPLLLCVLL